MKNTLLSFLGTNNYKKCNYYFEDQESGTVNYIQEAIIKLFCSEWNESDRILIFVTKEAREKNWNDKLKILMPSKINFEAIDIPEGLSEEEVWNIFKIVFDNINNEDNITFDITHSFRSLPMLGMVLLNYAKALKNIQVAGIYYGAFETLGPSYNIEDRIPKAIDRKAPILDLTSFSKLQDWTNASNLFINYGISEHIKTLAENEFVPLLKETKGTNKEAQLLRNLSNNIEKFSNSFYTSNGRDIIDGQFFGEIRETINEFSKTKILPAFRPLLFYISESTSKFTNNNINNGFQAVKWCINNNLIQQGFTLLQENIITYIADKHKLDYQNIKVRNDISSAFHIVSINMKKDKWKVNDIKFVEKLTNDELIKKLKDEYNSITSRRNKLNHANFTNKSKSTIKYKNILTENYNKIEKIIKC